MAQVEKILAFWFHELKPVQWFVKDEPLDKKIKSQFLSLHGQALQGELFSWRATAHGALAEILILDQFSRNIYRDNAQAFSQDGIALILAQTAIEKGLDKQLTAVEKSFLYMPYTHSESLLIHQQAIALFSQAGLEQNLEYEKLHLDIINRFGRYPHRNHILNRESSVEEIAFLQEPNSSF